MSNKARFLPTVFLAGLLAGSAAMLLLGSHSHKSVQPRASQRDSVDSYDLGDWSGHGAARQAVSLEALPSAPLGWY
jgi:hypothetical protein